MSCWLRRDLPLSVSKACQGKGICFTCGDLLLQDGAEALRILGAVGLFFSSSQCSVLTYINTPYTNTVRLSQLSLEAADCTAPSSFTLKSPGFTRVQLPQTPTTRLSARRGNHVTCLLRQVLAVWLVLRYRNQKEP